MGLLKLLIITAAIADYGNCLRCLCQSTINGVLANDPLPECDNNATCTISRLPNGDTSGLCYMKLELVVNKGGEDAVFLTYSCADLSLQGLALNPELCSGIDKSGDIYKEVVCCSGADYCNADLSLQAESRSPNTSSGSNTSSTGNDDDDDLFSVEVGLGIFAGFIVLATAAGLVFFATVFCYYRRYTHQTSLT